MGKKHKNKEKNSAEIPTNVPVPVTDPPTENKKPRKRKLKTLPDDDATNVDQEEQLADNTPLAVTEKLNADMTSNTNRSKKRVKHEELQKTLKDKFETKRREDVLQYLTAWKADKATWKFQKIKQMFIEKQIFNSEEIPDEIWSIALEYLSGSRDASKQALLESARQMMDQLKAKEDGKNDAKYKRAKQIVKMVA